MPLAPQITNTPATIVPIIFAIAGVAYTPSTATYSVTGHTFNIGDVIIVSDVAPAGYNGTFTIASVVAGSTVTVSNATNTPVTVSTGTAWQAPTDFTVSDNGVVFITDTTDPAGITTFCQGTTPTAIKIGDLWYDTSNGNRESRWDGSGWVLVQDTSIATALSNANTAISNAAAAQAQGVLAYNKALASLQPSAATIVNALNQITSIDGSGINIYSGSLGGAHVILNSLGLVGYNSSGTITTVINASDGILHVTGGIITNGSIMGTTLNVAGLFQVDAFGNMIASSATITGVVNATSGSFTGTVTTANLNATGGTIGGITINGSNGIIVGSVFQVTIAGDLAARTIISASTITASNGFSVVTGGATISGNFVNSNGATTTSAANVFINSTTGLIARVTSSKRYKVEILPEAIPAYSIMALAPKTWIDRVQFEENGNSSLGLNRVLGLIAEDLAELPVLKDVLVNYNEEGQPDSVNYDRIAITLIPFIQELSSRIAKLEGENK